MSDSMQETKQDESKKYGYIFVRSFWVVLTLIMIGVFDPILNAVVNAVEYERVGWLSRFVMELTGPIDIMQRVRMIDFWGFTIFAVSLSFFLSIFVAGNINAYVNARNESKREGPEHPE